MLALATARTEELPNSSLHFARLYYIRQIKTRFVPKIILFTVFPLYSASQEAVRPTSLSFAPAHQPASRTIFMLYWDIAPDYHVTVDPCGDEVARLMGV